MVRDTGTFLVEQYRNLRPSFRIRVLNTSALVVCGPAAAEMMAGNTGEVKAWKVWEGMIREFGGRQVPLCGCAGAGLGGGPRAHCRVRHRAGDSLSQNAGRKPCTLVQVFQTVGRSRVCLAEISEPEDDASDVYSG